MRRIIMTIAVLGIFSTAFCQTSRQNNGYNLKDYCDSESCLYFKFQNAMIHPAEGKADWEMSNVEVAVKKTGGYILTGDLAMSEKDRGARLNFEIQFFDKNDQLIYKEQSGVFEFFSEPHRAEPMVISGSLDEHISQQIDFLDFFLVSSEVVPYYELDSDCYGPCKSHELNVSIKEFKKLK
ncbi:hypothetical protein N6H18_13445 [Reichenbachiella agarivorans]|uniref:NlpE N-terminal domain-containing protein n=1 Tax=Reichenbachiella agarivorans TaxID=2979464 RepID=A0ABY6CLT4_9BACT|nr:hypothetical protein [Reichenbachiella agarivorans]UXP31354.1 hypothetical protein N6H18_13445 [Reichenbachiella agarivorans]